MLPAWLRPLPELESPWHELHNLDRGWRGGAGEKCIVAWVQCQALNTMLVQLEH